MNKLAFYIQTFHFFYDTIYNIEDIMYYTYIFSAPECTSIGKVAE